MLSKKTRPRKGIGIANGHHGEILQGMFYGDDGILHRGLVTLPWRSNITQARFIPDGSTSIKINFPGRCKAKAAAEIVGKYIAQRIIGGILQLKSLLPVARGLGSSTSDVVATIWAVADSIGATLSSYDVARLAVQAEIASDSVMFMYHTVLFAQREGIVLKHLEGPLPPMHILGIDTMAEGCLLPMQSSSQIRPCWLKISLLCATDYAA